LALNKFGVTADGLPWYATICATSIYSALLLMRPVSYAIEDNFGGKEPLRFNESWSITFLLAATLLYALVSLHSLFPPMVKQKEVRFVDIELTSNLDFSDKTSALPGTAPTTALRKRSSDHKTSQGDLNVKKEQERHSGAGAQAMTKTPIVNLGSSKRRGSQSEDRIAAEDKLWIEKNLSRPVSNATQKMMVASQVQPPNPADSRPFIEEVPPPELVEMVENEGDTDGMSVFQAGGHSEKGKGAKNALSDYLKQLHKRIKSAWSPPRGQSRRAEIIFRIKKNGHLSFVRILRTSGDTETDEAALKAVTLSVNSDELPSSYPLPYLDVRYSFNYRAEELQEVSNPK
jgi:outer membrane biosynthesis protein TonB